MKMTINIEDHKHLIVEILGKSGLTEENLIIVASPYEYANSKNLKNIKEDMIGYSYRNRSTGDTFILLKKNIDVSDIQHTLERVAYPLDRGRKQFLNTPEKFIEHLVRHEIEHCVYGKTQRQENEADEAALQKMGFRPRNSGF